ncbi:hypothetical protein MMC07_002221 [Pseudocyphellaria aurata]|nr:hypothetical protein [Pseudocyphellaria aurata]
MPWILPLPDEAAFQGHSLKTPREELKTRGHITWMLKGDRLPHSCLLVGIVYGIEAPDADQTNNKPSAREDHITACRARDIASRYATKIPAADVRKLPALCQHCCVGPNVRNIAPEGSEI